MWNRRPHYYKNIINMSIITGVLFTIVLIIILVIATMLLSSCQQETECMYANQVENCDEVD